MIPKDPLIQELLARLGAAIVERDRALEQIEELRRQLAETKKQEDQRWQASESSTPS